MVFTKRNEVPPTGLSIMDQNQVIPHLFRNEFRKISSVLCRHLGIAHIETAEDIASETFLLALETWPYKGIPPNPEAWIYRVAVNKAKNYIKRKHIFSEKVSKDIIQTAPGTTEMEIDLSEKNINDSQLQMLFAICHPSLSLEAQTGLALRILCGFGIEEIANAFLTSKETVNKRLYRAKEILRNENVEIKLPQKAEINKRLEPVLTTLYLLFNEGYYSESDNNILREDFCVEAMRLTYLLIENEYTNKPGVNALLSLMCFQSSRFAARKNEDGEMILYNDQNESLWNMELIANGVHFLHEASKGNKISKYHLEASIAYWHTIKTDNAEKWENILQLYNQLLQVQYSPIAALNRTYALSKTNGKKEAIAEAEKLKLINNHYYFTLLGELYTGIDDNKAVQNFENALAIAKTQADKNSIQKKLFRIIQ